MGKRYDILIRGGLIVSGSGTFKGDVAIKGDKIVEVQSGQSGLNLGADRTIEASGKYVLPGVIDVHVHPVYEDDMGGSSLTAAYGGLLP